MNKLLFTILFIGSSCCAKNSEFANNLNAVGMKICSLYFVAMSFVENFELYLKINDLKSKKANYSKILNDLKNRSISADLNEEEKALFSKLLERCFNLLEKNKNDKNIQNAIFYTIYAAHSKYKSKRLAYRILAKAIVLAVEGDKRLEFVLNNQDLLCGFKTGNKNLKKMDQENCLKKAQIISDIVCN